MATLRSPAGDIAAQRAAEGAKFFGRTIKGAGSSPSSGLGTMGRVQIARDEPAIGTLPKGDNTVGGVVGGLYDAGAAQGMKAGKA